MYKSMGYFGGKSAGNVNGIGAWIADRLPWEYAQTYIEPFAGMLGVLLQRRPVANEIANDVSGDIIHWWKTVQTDNMRLADRVDQLPFSRQMFEEYKDQLKAGALDGLERAVAFTMVLSQSFRSTQSSWKIS